MNRYFLTQRTLAYFVVLIAYQLSAINVYGEPQDQSHQYTRESCPLMASTESLQHDLTEFFVVGELSLSHLLDSVFEPIRNAAPRLATSLDSASYYYCHGLYHSRKSDYEQSKENFVKAEYLYDLHKESLALLYTRVHLCNLDYYIQLEEKAFHRFQELLEDPACDDYIKGKLNHNLGCLLMEVERAAWTSPDTSIKNPIDRRILAYFGKAIAFHTKAGNRSGLAATFSVYVNELLNLGDLERAKIMADSSVFIAQQINDQGRVAFALIKQGMLLDTLGRELEAIEVFDMAIQYFDSIGNISQKIHAMSGKRNSQIDAGLTNEALATTYQMYRGGLDFFDSELAEAHKRYEIEYLTKKKQLIIKEQEDAIEKKELEIASRNNLLAATILGALALGAFLLFLIQRNKRKAEREKDSILIKSKQEGIKAMIQAQEEERQRIAKDLHDGIVQQLGGLKLGLQKKLSASNDPESDRLITVLDDSAQELRELSHRMMPRSLKELGLVPALEDMLENSLGMADISHEFEHYGITGRLPESIEITLYRIAQELINNVIKHSAAKKASIQLFRTERDIVLIVEDNGNGFRNTKRKGIGLLNISSRLDTLNGHVNFEPSPESGTLATIRIPLSE